MLSYDALCIATRVEASLLNLKPSISRLIGAEATRFSLPLGVSAFPQLPLSSFVALIARFSIPLSSFLAVSQLVLGCPLTDCLFVTSLPRLILSTNAGLPRTASVYSLLGVTSRKILVTFWDFSHSILRAMNSKEILLPAFWNSLAVPARSDRTNHILYPGSICHAISTGSSS